MNHYEDRVRAMLRHATEDCDDRDEIAANIGEVVRACGIGIAIVAMGLPPEVIEQFMAEVSKGIAAQIRLFQAANSADIDSETFLRDHFNPGVFHG